VFDTLRLLRRIDPMVCLVAFGPRDEPVVADRCVLAGADVHLSKRLPVGEVLARLEQCAQAKRKSPPVWERSDSDGRGLSPRELEVLRLMGRGLSQREIASALHVSSKTVATHWSRLQEKLDLRSQWDAIACCLRTQPPDMRRTRVSHRTA
jgi:DNA-binding NarL/FixJ family response regulator